MGPLATLTLFPPHSLDTSILAAVLIGVILLAFFTETLGWVFVGLVVPGYLASLFVIHPEAGVTVTVEAILTYLLAVVLSRGISATGAWSEFFGRERFFLIVICSVLVRALSEVLLSPRIGALIDAEFGTTFVLDRSLHSIGLVLVPLTANAFWKLGLRRGVFQVGVPVALTWALLQFVLLPYTNLSFSSLELTYEDVAQRFLASPKAYIILLTTALIAARFNLKYGWDFNGILVAALVALTWLGPAKLLATLAEVLLLVLATRAVLSIPGIKTMNLEGPRKTVLVFVLGFILKFAIGWALGGRIAGLKVTDLFGFGYLVPTLLAVKILQKQVISRVLLPTVHTSLVGVIVGSLIGFPLSLLEPRQAVAAEEEIATSSGVLDRDPLGLMSLARATCREHDARWSPIRQRRSELREYQALWREADTWLETKSSSALAALREHAAKLDLELRRLEPTEDGVERFALIEVYGQGGLMGWGTAVLVPGAKGPVLEVPRPASEAPSAEAAAVLCERLACRAIVVSGMDTRLAGLTRGDALVDKGTPFQSAHDALEARTRLQVRADPALPRGRPILHGSSDAFRVISSIWNDASQQDAPPPEPGLNWGEANLAVLRAHPDDLMALVADEVAPRSDATDVTSLFSAATAPGSRTVPRGPWLASAELIVLEQQVAAPLLATTSNTDFELRARWASAMAQLLGLRVQQVNGCPMATPCWMIGDADPSRPRAGASLLIRMNGAPLVFQVPSPSRERGTLPVAMEAWRTANARALIFTDPTFHPDAQVASVTAPGEVETGFQAFHQAVQRSLPESALVLQIRGYAGRPVDADALIVVDAPIGAADQRPVDIEALISRGGVFEWLNGRTRYFDGAPELAGLTTPSPQQSFARAFGGAQFATLWLSEAVRGAYIAPDDAEATLAATRLSSFPVPARSLAEGLLTSDLRAPASAPPKKLEERFRALLATTERALSQRAVLDFRDLAWATGQRRSNSSVRVYRSTEHGLPWLMLEAREGRHVMRGAFFVQRDVPQSPVRVDAIGEVARAEIERAARQRAPVVVVGEAEGSRR